VEVHAADRIGVLHEITRALAELHLDIASAKIHTLGAAVVDSFYLRDERGRKIEDPALLVEIERALLHELAGQPS
jgi:[protein-PII] uridylyltransferase